LYTELELTDEVAYIRHLYGVLAIGAEDGLGVCLATDTLLAYF
jgi:hypothetical protein